MVQTQPFRATHPLAHPLFKPNVWFLYSPLGVQTQYPLPMEGRRADPQPCCVQTKYLWTRHLCTSIPLCPNQIFPPPWEQKEDEPTPLNLVHCCESGSNLPFPGVIMVTTPRPELTLPQVQQPSGPAAQVKCEDECYYPSPEQFELTVNCPQPVSPPGVCEFLSLHLCFTSLSLHLRLTSLSTRCV